MEKQMMIDARRLVHLKAAAQGAQLNGHTPVCQVARWDYNRSTPTRCDITSYDYKSFGNSGHFGADRRRISGSLVCENKAPDNSAHCGHAVLFRVCLFLAFV
jgi:hypothetical protein